MIMSEIDSEKSVLNLCIEECIIQYGAFIEKLQKVINMEEDIDIYADLPSFGTNPSENLDTKNEQDVLREQLELKNQITELTTKLDNFQKINENLEINLFSLLKTAKAEIARKDKMIGELRKELDDVMFKRGMYIKTNNIKHNKPDFCEAVLNVNPKWDSTCTVKKPDTEVTEADFICKQAGEHQTKCPLIPPTLFGERLLKRMTDKHHMEVKDLHVDSHINSEVCNQNIEYYAFESNKENGTISGNNTKEAASGTRSQSPINEHTKHMAKLAMSKDSVEDLQLKNETKVHPGLEQNVMLATRNSTGKRVNEFVDRQVPSKRIKSVRSEFSSDVRGMDACNMVIDANKEDSTIPQYRNFSSSTNSFEMRSRFMKDSEYSRNANLAFKKHGYFIREAKKREDKYLKDKDDAFRDKRNTINRSFKHHGGAVQNSMFSLSERNMDNRCIKISKKDDYRVTQDEHRWAKQKEHQRIQDHRSRTKPASPTKYREEQYSRSHNNYRNRCDKRYNFRCTDVNKIKLDKDAPNIRSMSKYSTTDEASAGEKSGDGKTHDGHAKFQSRKLKSESGNSSKRQRKQNEYNENVHQQIDIEKPIKSLMKYSELQEQSIQRASNVMIPSSQCVVTKSEHTVVEALQKHVKEKFVDSLSKIQDSEVLNTNNMQKGNICEESTCDSRCAFNEPKSSSKVDDIIIAHPDHSITTAEQMNESKLLLTVTSQLESISTNINTSQVEINSESVESVENMENIEKFIRDCASMNEEVSQKISTTVDVAHALDTSSMNTLSKVDNTVVLLDICNSENVTNDCCQSISNLSDVILSAKRDRLSDEICNKSTNKEILLYSSDTCTSNGKDIEMQVEQALSSKYMNDNLSSNEYEVPNSVEGAFQTKKVTEHSLRKHIVSPKDTNKEGASYNYMDNVGEKKTNMGKSLKNNCNIDKNSLNDYKSSATVKSKQKNLNMVMDVVPNVVINRSVRKLEMQSDNYEGLTHVQSGSKSVWDSSKNIQGKIVVFARRKKPVCLGNNNANMTILINKDSSTNVKSSTLKTAMSGCNSFLNVIKIGSNDEIHRS